MIWLWPGSYLHNWCITSLSRISETASPFPRRRTTLNTAARAFQSVVNTGSSLKQRSMNFTKQALDIDARAESDRIGSLLVQAVRKALRRQGAIVGISGGVDSSVGFALCVLNFRSD